MKKQKNSIASIKVTATVLLLVFIIFTVLNFLWIVMCYLPFRGCVQNTVEIGNSYIKGTDTKKTSVYEYYCNEPHYLLFNEVFYTVTPNDAIIESYESLGETNIDCYISPFSEPKCKVTFVYVDTARGEFPLVENHFYSVDLDKDGKITSDPNSESYKRAQKYLQAIGKDTFDLYDEAKEMWLVGTGSLMGTGFRAFMSDNTANRLFELFLFIAVNLSVICAYIWVLKVLVPFRKYCGDMKYYKGSDDFPLRKISDFYVFSAIDPKPFISKGLLSVYRKPMEDNMLFLILQKESDGWHYYAAQKLLGKSLRRSPRTEFAYHGKQIFTSDPKLKEQEEKLVDLCVQANLFWNID